MHLETLKLHNFRSYEQAEFELHPQLNIVAGPNGSGKTNLLEAAYLLSSARSFRGSDKDMVRHSTEGYTVEGGGGGKSLGVQYRLGAVKHLMVDGKKRKPERFVGQLPAVLFEPNSVNIVAGPPEERRRFLNRLLSAVDPKYLRALIEYKRVLRQRNALLRSKQAVQEQMFAWDIKLVQHANYIYEQRLGLLEWLAGESGNAYYSITQKKVAIELGYTATAGKQAYTEFLLEALNNSLERDMLLGYTTVGPHRDDVLVVFNKQLVTRVASRGEQRSLTLSLKLLELEHMEKATKMRPLVLLDDVFSELDEARRDYLIERLKGLQVLVTATDTKGINRALPKSRGTITLGKAHARRRQNVSKKTRSSTRPQTRPGTHASPKRTGAKVPKKSPRPQPQRRRS